MRKDDHFRLVKDIGEIIVVATLVVLPYIFLGTPTLLFVVGLLWVLAFVRVVVEARKVKHRRSSGLCLECGYNLTGNTTGVCSECGTAL